MTSSTSQRSGVFFIEYLTLRTWWMSVLPWLFTQFERKSPPETCYFIDASRLGLAVARVFSYPIRLSISQLDFQLNQIRDREGLNARIRIQHIDIDRVQVPILNGALVRGLVESNPESRRLRMYIAKQMALTTLAFERDNLFRALLVLQICDWKMRSLSRMDEQTTVFVELRPWFDQVQAYAAQFKAEAIGVKPTIPLQPKIINWVGPVLSEKLRDIRYLRPFAPLSSRHQPSVRPRPIAVEYYGQLNLNRPELHSDLMMNQERLVEGGKVNLIFSLVGDPLDEDKQAELAEHDIGTIVTHPAATTLKNVPLFRRQRKPTPAIRIPLSMPNSAEGRWIRSRITSYEADREYWEDLFRTHGTKVFLTWNKYDEKHCAITDAIERSGGVSVCYQRSLESDPCLDIAPAADVNLVFGRRDLSKEHPLTTTRCYVTVGWLGDHRFLSQRTIADRIKAELRELGASRILSFYDENSADDGRWYYGHSIMREAYGFLLERLLETPWLGLVLKPKVPRTLRRRLGPVAELLKRAEATGRCVVLEGGAVHGSYPPSVAALASDLAVHGHLWAGTAAVEAVLAGTPTLLMDRDGWTASELYQLGIGRVVFKELSELWRACLAHWSRPDGLPGFGNWDSMLDELDPFRDGRAVERMGSYVQWLLEALEGGLDRDRAVEEAAERYGRQWGKNKVQFRNQRIQSAGKWTRGDVVKLGEVN